MFLNEIELTSRNTLFTPSVKGVTEVIAVMFDRSTVLQFKELQGGCT